MVEHDSQFEYADSYKKSGDVGIREIALEQYRKCVKEGSKEMSQAGVMRRFIDGQVQEIVVPDQKEIFKNSVEMLKITLLPSFMEKENKKKYFKYIDTYEKQKKELKTKMIQESEKMILKPEVKHVNLTDDQKMMLLQSREERLISLFEKIELKIYRDLLQGIALLLHELNWFEEHSAIAGDIY